MIALQTLIGSDSLAIANMWLTMIQKEHKALFNFTVPPFYSFILGFFIDLFELPY